MKKNRIVLVAVLVLLLVGVLAGCGDKHSHGSEGAALFPQFETVDLAGKGVDYGLFAGNKLTMVNIWGTFCGPCIDEMPDLARLGKEMPEGTALVGLVMDAVDKDSLDLAKKIVSDNGVGFTNIVPDEALKAYVNENVTGVPTTIFVDASGKIVGDAVLGTRDFDAYMEVVTERLGAVGGGN
jgi:thiol-disulfide isomerase/thioredoxin